MIVIQGAAGSTAGRSQFNGGWFAVLCDPFGLDELTEDLEEEERNARSHIQTS